MSVIGEAEGGILVATAREAIAAALENRSPRYPDPGAVLAAASGGLFVSLHRRGSLRGCIGNLTSARPLAETAKSMAAAAAFEDPRFLALTSGELADLEVEITVLGDFFPIAGPKDFEIGRHGLFITTEGKSGILLPQVAVEYSWGPETFLAQVCRKAGLDAAAWKSPDARIYAFAGSVFC